METVKLLLSLLVVELVTVRQTSGEAVLYRRLEGLEVQVLSLRPVEGESVSIILLHHNHQ